MEIEIAKNIGFCFGVKRAVAMAEKAQRDFSVVYTLGELIHNETVVDDLRRRSIIPVNALSDVSAGQVLIIRSHGVGKEVFPECERRGIKVIDATCPFVSRIHRTVEREYAMGAHIVIIGKANHPEVIGINGYCGGTAVVISTPDEGKLINLTGRTVVVSQTTFDIQKFYEIKQALNDDVIIYNTICSTTKKRQDEAIEMSKRACAMVIIGGKNSSNTQKLAVLCRKYCKIVKTIDNPRDVTLEKSFTNGIIGLVAGASTPDWMIREVITRMNELDKTAKLNGTESGENSAVKNNVAAAVDGAVNVAAAETANAKTIAQDAQKKEEGATQQKQDTKPLKTVKPIKDEAPESDSSFADEFEKTLVRIRNGQVLMGTVVQIVDGEVCVNIGYKSDGFIPKNELSDKTDVDANQLYKVGDKIEVEVTKVNDGEGNVLLSRKNVESKRLWEVLVNDEDVKDKIFEGIGKQAVKGGLLATINGIEAFIPASMLSTKYVADMSVFVGKPLKLYIVEVDKSKRRIIASHKKVLENERVEERKNLVASLNVGDKFKGRVKRIVEYGAFVDIGGIDGMVHITDLARHRIKHPSDVLTLNQEIDVIILAIDREKMRISLGYKQLLPSPWVVAKEKYTVGDIVEGKVIRIVPFGAFVALDADVDGLIHISRVGVRRINAVEDELKVGETVRVKITDIDTDAKRISLSRRDAILDEHPEIVEELKQEREALEAQRMKERTERNEARSVQDKQTDERARRDAIRTAPPRTEQRRDRPQRSDRPQQGGQGAPDRPQRSDRPQGGDRPQRSDRPQQNNRPQRSNEYRQDRGRRFSEDGEYELPPMETATTSLANLLKSFTPEIEPDTVTNDKVEESKE
ncbi:MAG: bifunctional 4-hydroxy-3-methylbut-2-enyl diphosphate reductase/30S ribosomal protein S1 [Clostridia bacterium]